jgi:hypothetical protein
MPSNLIAQYARQLTLLVWDVAKATGESGGETAAMRACEDLNAVDRAITILGNTGYDARYAAGCAKHTLDDYAREIAEAEGVESFLARLWREAADTADDLRALLDDDRNVNPDDVCREPQAHLDYLDAALQVPIELIGRWRQLVEDHTPAEALEKALREVGR